MVLLLGAMASRSLGLSIGLGVVLAVFNLAMLVRHVKAGDSWVIRVEESRFLVKVSADTGFRRRAEETLRRACALELAVSEITDLRGVEYEILWPWGGRTLRQQLLLEVGHAEHSQLEPILAAIHERTQVRNPEPWLVGYLRPDTFLTAWESTYTPKMTTFLELIGAGTTVPVSPVERRGLDLRGFPTLPLKDVENRLRILAELGYRELCVRLLVSERQMTRSWASEYLEQVLADDRGR
ncbi:MAG: hypothetical protein IPJ98_06960 [Bryobacterales bacterium]|nr:hypothetical protein [Bryobacterales bacterium]